MKKILNLWLLAALVCGLGLGVTSCKDDDDDSKSEEQQQQEQEERASKFWSVVGQLVSSDSYAADYEDKTFEPTYGVADAANATTRIVETNDMQTAAQRFSDLVGAAIDENTPSYTYSDPEVGTLTYTRGGTADDWATVDVNIKQVPHLRKIIYREGGEGTNASFAGKAWYRFGDVVSRTLDDGNVEYWICVRPAFSPEKKGDSHWVCLNYLPAKNVYHYRGSNELEYYLPTGIGTDKENMQNLAEMLYAMMHPQEWYDNANTYHTDGKVWGFSGLPIFADFKKANVMYHNQYFWQKVAEAWERNEVANKAFGIDFEVLSDHLEQEGLNLLYEGYQWWFKTSWNCKLHQASYTNGTKNDEKNLHHAEYKDISKSMKEIPFDCREMGALKQNYNKFFDNDGKYRWVVRHATGADLNGGSQPAPTSRLQGPGIQDVYRYYEEYEDEWYKLDKDGGSGPEITEMSYNDPAKWDKTAYQGPSHYKTGYIYKDQQGHRWICIGQSGIREEESPYAEFISFDGLTASADKRCITNLPTRDEAIRAGHWLDMIFSMSSDYSCYDKLSEEWKGKQKDYAHIVLNCRQWADCDPSLFFQRIHAQNNDVRQDTHAASIAYNDGSGRQRLLRWIMNNQNAGNELIWYLADNYVDKPDPNEQKYAEAAYGTTPIYLDDLTSADFIGLWATDTYAKQPLAQSDAKNNDGPTAARNYRTATDRDATDATKYLYDKAKWDSRTFKTDMWNAPILMFRYTRAYDRGDNEYSTHTTSGQVLSLYKEHRWLSVMDMGEDAQFWDEAEKENYDEFVGSTLLLQVQNMKSADTWHLNGKTIAFPKWNTIGN